MNSFTIDLVIEQYSIRRARKGSAVMGAISIPLRNELKRRFRNIKRVHVWLGGAHVWVGKREFMAELPDNAKQFLRDFNDEALTSPWQDVSFTLTFNLLKYEN